MNVNNTALEIRRESRRLIGLLTALSLIISLLGFSASAQGVLTGSQTGVIQDLVGNGDAQLTISGVVYTYDREETVFTLRGEEISDADLEVGMVLRFTQDDGVLGQVQVLGPNNLIENFDSH